MEPKCCTDCIFIEWNFDNWERGYGYSKARSQGRNKDHCSMRKVRENKMVGGECWLCQWQAALGPTGGDDE